HASGFPQAQLALEIPFFAAVALAKQLLDPLFGPARGWAVGFPGFDELLPQELARERQIRHEVGVRSLAAVFGLPWRGAQASGDQLRGKGVQQRAVVEQARALDTQAVARE